MEALKKQLKQLIHQGKQPEINEILKQYPQLLNDSLDQFHQTALILASGYHQVKVVQALLAYPDIDVNKKNLVSSSLSHHLSPPHLMICSFLSS